MKVVGRGAEKRIDTDVAVLALEKQLSPSFSLPAKSSGLVWGQNVFFLGFPYGLHTSVNVNNGFPVPLVKGAIFSGSVGHPPNPETFLLDGHNNPGFSGGPVVFRPQNNPRNEFQVMAVVSAFHAEDVDIKFQNKSTGLKSETNTGIVVCPSIKQVVEIISANPIGAEITN